MSRFRAFDPYAPRIFIAALAICAGVLAFAYYLQHVRFLDPCPWCVAQRVLFMAIGLLSLIALLHRRAPRLYGILATLIALSGLSAAAYQTWLQRDPARSMSCMGSWLERTLDALQLGKLWPNMFQYDGPCTLAPWSFLQLTIPQWSLLSFTVLAAAFLSLLFRRAQSSSVLG